MVSNDQITWQAFETTNVHIKSFNCTPQRSHQFEMAGKYRQPKYKLISKQENQLILKVYSSLASGERYMEGSAEIKGENLYLTCHSVAGDTIAFELEPWEITYDIILNDKSVPNRFYFEGELLTELNL